MLGWTIAEWLAAYRDGATPAELLRAWRAQLRNEPNRLANDARGEADAAWIAVIDDAGLDARIAALEAMCAARPHKKDVLPLYGVPFAVKDNIDVAGFDTSAGCPAFAYRPQQDAAVVERLVRAGAIPVGKANLDQFATGLVGTRTPFGIPCNTFDRSYVSGGSSSGSAVLVAQGQVPFSLGTDTAGSGRVPAGLNNLFAIKPTRGALSNVGVVPACRTLDCVSIFALDGDDALRVYDSCIGFDARDGMSRASPDGSDQDLPVTPRFGVPATPEFFGDAMSADAFDAVLAAVSASGATCVPLDFSIFDEVAALLYEGPWVAERYAAIRAFAARNEAAIDPVVRDVIFTAQRFSAADAFDGLYRLADLKRRAEGLLAQVDALLVPTAPTHLRIADVLREPIRLNSQLGKYTNFVNLLDWSAVSVPAALRVDGLPFGVTLISDSWRERALSRYARAWHATRGLPLGATQRRLPAGRTAPSATPASAAIPAAASAASATAAVPSVATVAVESIRVAVVGAHLRGMPLNHELTSRGARFVKAARTASCYRLYALPGTTPPKPGLVRGHDGAAIDLELWDVPADRFGGFVQGIPAPLGIGTLLLDDDSAVKGFICEPAALDGARDITAFGGWKAFLAEGTEASDAPSFPS
ncbi:allophanate hydrolase [Chitinasiproducens palmae]|uniref:Allophanate hydrolase n=1 Tax=Chitinasiproducens palmae TaxID=1770053 RepID=A0A1H2PK93_9BURK|nr:allophanate hydrolase [Chitinasiproducens palmae]SDV46717.1 allophanate hydrolase [Chitinasiproducens palmae]